MLAEIPKPDRASKSVAFGNSNFLALADSTMASPSGCSEPCSAAAARRSSSSSDIFCVTIRSVTVGFPSVMVPVLSKTMVWIFLASSRASPDLMRTPYSAPLPVPTMMAVGVAKPRAQGQAMTKTEMRMEREKIQDSCPRKYQARPDRRARPITIGTKTAETWSANLAIGALDP